jgi:hypothetical protein
MRLRSSIVLLSVCALAIGVAACENQKAPAEAAVKAAQDSFAPISAEARKYVPDQASAVQASITSAQDALSKSDYAAALTKAQAIPAQISALGPAIAAKKTQLTSQWTTLEAGVPKLLEALRSRVEMLSKSKSLPKGIDKLTLDNAKSGLASATITWDEAVKSAASGDVATAVSNVSIMRTRITDFMRSLNMQVPPGAGGL